MTDMGVTGRNRLRPFFFERFFMADVNLKFAPPRRVNGPEWR